MCESKTGFPSGGTQMKKFFHGAIWERIIPSVRDTKNSVTFHTLLETFAVAGPTLGYVISHLGKEKPAGPVTHVLRRASDSR